MLSDGARPQSATALKHESFSIETGILANSCPGAPGYVYSAIYLKPYSFFFIALHPLPHTVDGYKSCNTLRTLNYRTIGLGVYSLLTVMQDLYHQP